MERREISGGCQFSGFPGRATVFSQRAQAGEAMAGGAADWNEGVPVGVGAEGRWVYWECGSVESQNVKSFAFGSYSGKPGTIK